MKIGSIVFQENIPCMTFEIVIYFFGQVLALTLLFDSMRFSMTPGFYDV